MAEGKFYSNVPVERRWGGHLERPRMDHILEKALRFPVVSVSAGAGFGKTVAVHTFLQARNFMTVWLQFSELDNIPARFWENFTGAVSMLSQETAAKLMEAGFPETDRQFARYVKIPRSDVIQDAEYVFVYDDIHLITDRRVLRFLERSITVPFPNIRSVLVFRMEPVMDFESMSKAGILSWVNGEDLRFTRDELSRYFSLAGIVPSAEVLHSVYRDTEGWAFAVRLAALALKNDRPGYALYGMKSNIFRFIETEVMPALGRDVEHFLAKLSLLEHPARELVREMDSTGEFIRKLDAAGSFIQYDSYREAYRVHHLFLEYLRGRQDALVTEAERKELFLRAARWSFENQHLVDGIHYCEEAKDYAALFQGLAPRLSAMIPFRIAQILFSVFERANIPLEEMDVMGWIVYTRIFVSMARFDDLIRELNGRIIPALNALPPSARKHTALAVCHTARGRARFLAEAARGDLSFIEDYERAWYYQNISGYVPEPPVNVGPLWSWLCLVKGTGYGEMERFLQVQEKVASYCSAAWYGYFEGLGELSRAECAFFREDFEGVEHYARMALEKARAHRQYEIENRSLFYLLRMHLVRGDGEAVRDCLRQIMESRTVPVFINRQLYCDIAVSWFYVRIGMPDRAAPWLKSGFEESDFHSLIHGLETLVRAHCLFAERRWPAVLAALGDRENNFDGAGAFLFGRISFGLLQALARYRLHDTEGAFASFEEAWSLAAPQRLFMAFTEMGKDTRTVVDAYIRSRRRVIPEGDLLSIRRNAAACAKKTAVLGKAFRKGPENAAGLHEGAAYRKLSARERQVLDGLGLGLTREETARELSISVNTVKSVTRSIYVKLGALNRADALRIALTGNRPT